MPTWGQLPGNDSKSLFKFRHHKLKIAPRDAVPARAREPPAAVRESELALYPVFCETISDNGLLCQREVGLQAELDVASIWERVSYLDTSFTGSDEDLQIVAHVEPESGLRGSIEDDRVRGLGISNMKGWVVDFKVSKFGRARSAC